MCKHQGYIDERKKLFGINLKLSCRQNYREMVIKTVKDLEFYPTGNLTSYPALVSWMQAENTRFPGLRQRTLFSWLYKQHELHVGICSSLHPSLTGVMQRARVIQGKQWD